MTPTNYRDLRQQVGTQAAAARALELGRSFSSCESVASRYIHPIESNGPVTRGTKEKARK